MRWWMLLGLLWAGTAVAESRYVTVRLTHDEVADRDPVVNSVGQVAWIASSERSPEVFLHDGFRVVQLTDDDVLDHSVVINDAGRVVWTRELDNGEISLFDDGVVVQLTRDLGDSLLLDDRAPAVNVFGHIAWMKHDAVMYYDRRTRRPLATGAFGSPRPVINRRGEVAWAQGSTSAPDVYLFARGVAARIATNGGPPRINDRGTVVWIGRAGSARGVYRWDRGSTRLVATGAGIAGVPSLNARGDIAWSAFDGNDTEIYLLSSSVVWQITDNDVDDFDPDLNDRGLLVWVQGNGSASEVMLFTGFWTRALSQGGLNWSPAISNTGHVVWWGRKGADPAEQEIHLALPVDALLERLFRFFERSVLDGGLFGATPGDLESFEASLGEVEARLGRDPLDPVCPELSALRDRIGADSAPDPITGPDSADFRVLMDQVTDALGCARW